MPISQQVATIEDITRTIESPDSVLCDSTLEVSSAHTQLISKQKQGTCGNCDVANTEPTMYCHLCKINFCYICEEKHNDVEVYSEHKTDPISRLKYCSIHPSLITHKFCNACEQYICHSCLMENNHKGHEIVTYDNKVINLKESLKKIRNICLDEVNAAQSELPKMCNDLKANQIPLKQYYNESQEALKKMKEVMSHCNNITEDIAVIQTTIRKKQIVVGQVDELLTKGDLAVVEEGQAILGGRSDNARATTYNNDVLGELRDISDRLDFLWPTITETFEFTETPFSESASTTHSEHLQSLSPSTFQSHATPNECRKPPKRRVSFSDPPDLNWSVRDSDMHKKQKTV